MGKTITTEDNDDVVGLAIGAVAKATGIPVETLRTWERRYGFPDPARTASGHRVYDAGTVPHLRLIAQALEQGHRASNVLRLSVPALRSLVTPAPLVPTSNNDDEAASAGPDWITAVVTMDDHALTQQLTTALNHRGLLGLLTEDVAPFLRQVGDLWMTGDISVSQEHFASEVVRDFLSTRWRIMSSLNDGGPVVCSTLPNEAHSLGLHMVACVLALAGRRVVFLGAETPTAEIAATAERVGAAMVAVSISAVTEATAAESGIAELRDALPSTTRLVIGGEGSRPVNVDEVTRILSLQSFFTSLTA